MATQTSTQRKAAGKKAAATRKRNAAARQARTTRASANRRAATARGTGRRATRTAATRVDAETTRIDGLAYQAERAVLVPVGAALTARDTVLDAAKPFRSVQGTEREIKKFERRGVRARRDAQRRVKRTRTRVERELRQRRRRATQLVKRNRRNLESQVRSARRDFATGADRIQGGVGDLARDVERQLA
jgi:hypothetical protein